MNPPQDPPQARDQHFSKRTLRPATSLPTTAETYGQKHGIDPNLTLALQNIGRRGRQSIAQPTFQRTSTAPVISFNSPSPYAQQGQGQGQGQGFQNHHQIMEQAQGIINKEKWRSSRNELRPYGSTSTLDDQEPRETGMDNQNQAEVSPRLGDRGTKRVQEEDEEEGTEVDEDEFQDPSTVDNGADFPEVFNSPNLSQPELFQKQTRFAVPQLPDRAKRGLPARRTLGKTVSAPVGRLGMGMGMDVDGEGEDGFSIAEWAGKEDF